MPKIQLKDINPGMSPEVVRQIALTLRPEPDITHEEFDHLFYQVAHGFGWRAAHFRPAQTSKGYRTPVSGDGKGFLDWLCVRDRLVVIELKTKKDKLRPDQEEWKAAWEAIKAEVHVFWPKDWEELVDVLSQPLMPKGTSLSLPPLPLPREQRDDTPVDGGTVTLSSAPGQSGPGYSQPHQH